MLAFERTHRQTSVPTVVVSGRSANCAPSKFTSGYAFLIGLLAETQLKRLLGILAGNNLIVTDASSDEDIEFDGD